MVKRGLGDSYDKVKYLPLKLRGYIDLTKPASSVAVGTGYLLASLFYYFHTEQSGLILQQPTKILAVSLSIFLIHSASQSLNMAEDAEMDRETPHKQDRPIPSGIVTEDEARTVTWFCSGWGVSLAFMVNVTFGILSIILLLFGVFYNLDPIRAKERIISIPWQAASRGLLSFPTVWAAYGDPLDPLAWTLGLFMFFYVMAFQNSADILDKEVDEEHGIQTFVVAFGLDGTLRIALVCTGAMMATLSGGYFLKIVPTHLLTMVGILPLCLYMLHFMDVHRDSVSDISGNSPMWGVYYLGMVLCVSIPLVSSIFFS